jgi:hypothetical protein
LAAQLLISIHPAFYLQIREPTVIHRLTLAPVLAVLAGLQAALLVAAYLTPVVQVEPVG